MVGSAECPARDSNPWPDTHRDLGLNPLLHVGLMVEVLLVEERTAIGRMVGWGGAILPLQLFLFADF